MQQNKTRAIEAIRQAHSILIAGHLGPDGDAIGSMLGLARALKKLGKYRVEVICPDGVPQLYRFLPGSDEVLPAPTAEGFDLAVALDCDGEARLGASAPHVFAAAKVVDIDHHNGIEPFGDIFWIDPTAAATGEMVYEIIAGLGVSLDEEMATCLLTALMVDTGSFRFANTSSRTFAVASRLLEAGARTVQITARLYEEKAYSAAKLLGIALSRISRSEDEQIVWSWLMQSDFTEAGAVDDETEGIINQLRSIRGGKVAVLFRETAEGGIKVSLRSRNSTDVSQVARKFGGGGHKPAAGCTIEGSMEEAQRLIISELEEILMGKVSST